MTKRVLCDMLHDICSPKKLPPVGGPNSIRKVRFLRFSLERARRRDRRLNECPHAPELLSAVGGHTPSSRRRATNNTYPVVPTSPSCFSSLAAGTCRHYAQIGLRREEEEEELLPPHSLKAKHTTRGGGGTAMGDKFSLEVVSLLYLPKYPLCSPWRA